MNKMSRAVIGAFVPAAIFFAAHTEVPASFQDMICKGRGESSRTAASCRTRTLDDVKSEITCRPAGHDVALHTYVCAYRIRDWGTTSSPYAHTSQVWTCEGGDAPVYLFEMDYQIDANRCNTLCGRCNSGWRQAGEGKDP